MEEIRRKGGMQQGGKQLQSTRQKIRTSQLLNRLQDFASGKKGVDMSPAQVNAALGVLRKALPDMQAIEQKTEIEVKTILTEPVMDESSWSDRFTDTKEPDAKEIN